MFIVFFWLPSELQDQLQQQYHQKLELVAYLVHLDIVDHIAAFRGGSSSNSSSAITMTKSINFVDKTIFLFIVFILYFRKKKTKLKSVM